MQLRVVDMEMSPLLGIYRALVSCYEVTSRQISYIQGFSSSERFPRKGKATQHRGWLRAWVKVVAAQVLFDEEEKKKRKEKEISAQRSKEKGLEIRWDAAKLR